MIVYCDGIYDIFHYGHIQSFKKCKKLFEDVFLIIGIMNDETATSYKRPPIFQEKHRYALVENSKYVDKIIKNAPLIITKEFMEEHNIDLVVHGFSNPNDLNNQTEFFKYPQSINKFKEIKYCKEISTTDIINKIKKM